MRTLPARMHVKEAAWYLGFGVHDIPILVSKGLLKPLGNPAPNGGKYFAASVLAELRLDVGWLARASNAIVGHWRCKNAPRSKFAHIKSPGPGSPTQNPLPTTHLPPG